MTNNSNFWSNGGFRKRKAAATDLEEKYKIKFFILLFNTLFLIELIKKCL
jgi:hypothetical protein